MRLKIKLNEEQDCFALSSVGQFSVYNTNPLGLRFKRDMGRALALVEILRKTNIVALVYQDDPKHLVIWDDNQEAAIDEMDFSQDITNVLIRGQDPLLESPLMMVILEHQVYLYEFNNCKVLYRGQSGSNPTGMGSLTAIRDYVMAFPGEKKGSLTIHRGPINEERTIKAHQSSLSQIQLNPSGQMVATASKRGTLIRIWSTANGQLLKEVRRGLEATEMHCIRFSPDSHVLAVTSLAGTGHLYQLDFNQLFQNGLNYPRPITLSYQPEFHNNRNNGANHNHNGDPNNQSYGGWLKQASKSIFKSGKDYLPTYFNSEGSLIQIPISDNAVCALLDSQEIVFWSKEGQYAKYRYQLSPPNYRQMELVELL